jgi:hypothetical protein
MKHWHYLFWGIWAGLAWGCTSRDNAQTADIRELSTEQRAQLTQLSGKALATAVCGSCHLFPEPQLLAKDVWQKGVLPRMGLYLGIPQSGKDPYRELRPEEITTVINAGTFPERPLLDSVSWAKINAYYRQEAPEAARPQDQKAAPVVELPLFAPVSLRFDNRYPPLTTLIRHEARTGYLWVGDGQGIVRRLDSRLRVKDSVRVESPPADLVTGPGEEALLVLMGVMVPNDLAAGKLVRLRTAGTLSVASPVPVLENLVRPVQATVGDFDADGVSEYIICNYGNNTGSLSWYPPAAAPGAGAGKVLKAAAGFRKTVVRDLNGDEKPDLVALTAQGNEGIWAFENQGGGTFEEKPLLRFPPVYGSSYFELVDFNGDGFEDILYTNGDNADYSVSLKKYHGVRLFLNDGHNAFKEAWFYPLHGAMQTAARDFDGDGDLDIAAIAFFPDYEKAPEEGFVYLENKGNLEFTPRTFKNAARGKWLVMETGDFDGDHDTDIALGSFTYGAAGAALSYSWGWQREGASVLVLHNTLKNPAQ